MSTWQWTPSTLRRSLGGQHVCAWMMEKDFPFGLEIVAPKLLLSVVTEL